MAGPGSLQGYYGSYKEAREDFLGWSGRQTEADTLTVTPPARRQAVAGAGDDVELETDCRVPPGEREDEGSYTQLRTLRHHGEILRITMIQFICVAATKTQKYPRKIR